MAKAATKARVTKKQVIAHRTKSARDMSPGWDGADEWNAEKFTKHFRDAMTWYRLESSVKELKNNLGLYRRKRLIYESLLFIFTRLI